MTTSESIALVYVTVKDAQEAESIASALLEKKLIACANLFPQVTSLYEWEGTMRKDAETVLILKTRPELTANLAEEVEKLHSYDCPCIVGFESTSVNKPFHEFIHRQTKG